MLVLILVENYIFVFKLSLPSCYSQLSEVNANEFKHEVISAVGSTILLDEDVGLFELLQNSSSCKIMLNKCNPY